jgi:hypothetical protein
MPEFVSEQVADVRDDPSSGDIVTVVVQARDDNAEPVKEWVTAHGGEVTHTGHFGLVEASIPETEVPTLCDQNFTRSVESPDDAIRFHAGGN